MTWRDPAQRARSRICELDFSWRFPEAEWINELGDKGRDYDFVIFDVKVDVKCVELENDDKEGCLILSPAELKKDTDAYAFYDSLMGDPRIIFRDKILELIDQKHHSISRMGNLFRIHKEAFYE